MKKRKGIRCSLVSVRGCKHGFFCGDHFVEHKESMFEQKELDSAIYEEVVQMRSVRGKEIRQARRDRPKQVQKILSFLLIKALSLSPTSFLQETPGPLHIHSVTATLAAGDVIIHNNSMIPFALVPKTDEQRTKIVTMILGPPPGTSLAELVSLHKEISESSICTLSQTSITISITFITPNHQSPTTTKSSLSHVFLLCRKSFDGKG